LLLFPDAMRWTAPFCSYFSACLLGLGLLLGSALPSRAQATQGLVPDSTEARVLHELYLATQGDQWTSWNRDNWPTSSAWPAAPTSADFGTWRGVGVRNGDIVSLDRNVANLHGSLPASLGLLTQLTALNLANNTQLTGELPTSLGQLTHLTYLATSNSPLGGPLPTSMGQLTALQELRLESGRFSGPLPAWLGSLPQLRVLSLVGNRFTGPLPAAWQSLTSLQRLELGNSSGMRPGEGNVLTGGIPAWLGQLTSLTYLDLSLNPLGGPIPPQLGNLTNLTFLELDGCALTGAVPAAVTQLPALGKLILGYGYPYYTGYNTLTSLPAPGSFANLASTALLLQYNQFEFGALEPYFSGPGQAVAGGYLAYQPQTLPQNEQTVAVTTGQPTSFASGVGGARTHYQWQRQVGGTWATLPGASATAATYQLAAATRADAGRYRCQATNDFVTGLTLTTRVYVLDVRDPGARNVPDDTNTGLALARPHLPADSAAAQPADMNYVRTWVPQVPLTASQATPAAACAASGYLLREHWDNLSSPTAASLPVTTAPTSTSLLPALEGPTGQAGPYGERLRGYLCPPSSGRYTFWLAGEAGSELWLSPGDNPAHRRRLATVPATTGPRAWGRYPQQRSLAVTLLVGQRYYIEVLHPHQSGPDAVAVAWQRAGQPLEAPLSGQHLTPYGQPGAGQILREQWDPFYDIFGHVLATTLPDSVPATRSVYLSELETPRRVGENYIDRTRGYLTPEVSGDYTFWIAGDDDAEFWLSSDENPAHKQRLIYLRDATHPREWDKGMVSQMSTPQSLVAGQRYYIELLHREGWGDDYAAVAWQRAGDPRQGPIPGRYLSPYQLPHAGGRLLREQWNNVPGPGVASLPGQQPVSSREYLSELAGPSNVGDHYGARVRGYVTAPVTGAYTFWVASAGASALQLSTDETPAHLRTLATVPDSTGPQQWTKYTQQRADSVQLIAGQRYYLQVLHQAGTGSDHLAVAWRLPDGTVEGPIPGPRLSLPDQPTAADSAKAADTPDWVVEQALVSTQYLDGLGRPVQTVRHEASPSRLDLVQAQAYDALGREPRQYLPFADSTHDDPGHYRPRALTQQQQFYGRTTPPGGGLGPLAPGDPIQGVVRTGAAFAETRFEASPLNRVLAQGAPGEAWQLGAGHAPSRLERPNLASDSVPRFAPGYDPRSLDPGYQGLYAAGELWGTQTTDEHGGRNWEWKDKEGQVVLKQIEAGTVGSSAGVRWLRTSYVYDDFPRLRFVLQPAATKLVLATGVQAAPFPTGAAPFVFHYRYDGRGRQVAKQVPGTDGETLVVYDQLDRPVLSQDAQQRTRREWSWTKYDALGRVVLSGLTTRQDTLGQVTLQSWATADTATSHQYEQRSGDLSAHPQYYTLSQAFPKLGAAAQQGFASWQTLTATYYDDYDFDNDGAPDAQYDTSQDGQFASGSAPVADALRTTGLVTRTRTRVLGVAANDATQADWLTTTTFYDERARPVQVQTTNARKGTDLLTTQLDFPGRVVQSVARHEGPSHTPVLVQEFFTYDHTGRVLATRQQLPGEARAARLDSVQYNELGQVTRKSLGTGRLLQEVDYAYNVRGWLTQLNDPHQPAAGDLFSLSLHYETGFTKGFEQYNGNLTGQTWRGRDGVQRAYGYAYDPVNRLLQGDFVARVGGSQGTLATATAWTAEPDNYGLAALRYDDNGNILGLRRRGLLQNATSRQAKRYGAVDDLSYAYAGNRLQAVDDAVTGNQLAKPATYHGAPTSLAGDFQEASVRLSQEYGYDANGNLTQDQNKGITGIAYNHLNLPRQLHFGTGADSIVFRYSAGGQKVAKLVYQTGQARPQRTDYLGPYQYEQDSLRFFPHAQGRVLRFVSYDPAGQAQVSYQREYTLKDHLGNLRLAYRLGQTRTYAATLEQDATTRKRETQQFDSLSVSIPVAQQVGMSLARTGTYAALLNAGGASPQPIGPLTQLTVQKGDTLRVSAPGRYQQAVQSHSFAFSLASFVASLLQPAPAGAPPRADGSRRGGLPLLQVGLNAGSLAALTQPSNGVPKGYLRVLVFNQDSVLVAQRTVQLSQAALNNYEVLQTGYLPIQQDGYVSVYVGNESAVDVLFDDVQVEYRQGLLVQETQYDPAGLELAGLAPPSPGIRGLNNYRFNGKEFQPDLGLAWNHQDWRFFDPQLLRWHAGDPELENGQESWTPYSFGYDNAVRYADADGRCPGGCPPAAVSPGVLQQAWAAGVAFMESNPASDPRMELIVGAGAAAVFIGTVVSLNWDKLPSAQQLETAFVNGMSVSGGATFASPGMYSPYMQMYTDSKAQAAVKNASGRVDASNSKVSGKTTKANKTDEQKLQERADRLNKKDRSGEDFTEAGKDVVKKQNAHKNGGKVVCENCGTETVPGKVHKTGVTPPGNEAQVDHIKRRSEGGRGNPDNGQVLCRDCNLEKH
jgi:RHS repeat-associated protein